MVGVIMKDPLLKRLPREFRSDFGKYLVIFVLIIGSIGLTSGFLVADNSMIAAYQESFQKYNIEDGHFLVDRELNQSQISEIRQCRVKIYPLHYVTKRLTDGSRVRIYQNRLEINCACVMEGRLPRKKGEIAIDRMYADNNHRKIGDRIKVQGGKTYRLVGLVALSDYSALFENNNDVMFDAIKFGVGVVSSEEFQNFSRESLQNCYAFSYLNPPKNEAEESKRSNDFLDDINDIVSVKDYVPRYQSQAITFTGEDMGSDKAMMLTFLYIIIAIIAFVFAVTITNTISKEANVIGTLMASGYTKGELVKHYMTMPALVTLVSAVIGNILGYTFFKDYMAGLYYHSYSLPTFHTLWNGEAFVETTQFPIILMIVINYVVLRYQLTLPIMSFLRRDLHRVRRTRAIPLSKRIPFFARFRMRIIGQNFANYLILFIGLLFANVLLIFGLALPRAMRTYTETMKHNKICQYQYILKVPTDAMNEDRKVWSLINLAWFQMQTDIEQDGVEAFSIDTLRSTEANIKEEDITLYGVKKDSKYIHRKMGRGTVLVSDCFAEKYQVEKGDKIRLKKPYENQYYHLKITGIYPYQGGVCIFMNQEDMNEMLDLGQDYYSGYFSNHKLKDLDSKNVASVVDINALTKDSRQLLVSMGGMASMVGTMAVAMFIILVYLLSKVIIEKNAQSISMTKILGYQSYEIARLYILSTTIMVLISLFATIPLAKWIIMAVFRMIMRQEMVGWVPFQIDSHVTSVTFALGVASYVAVACLELLKIRRVPMREALKTVE